MGMKREIDLEYERANARSMMAAMRAGREDALAGAEYQPTRVPYHEHRDALSVTPYIDGWTSAVLERSPWRRLVYGLCWRIQYRVARVGPGCRGIRR